MVKLYDKYAKQKYKTTKEILQSIKTGKEKFIIEIPNNNIKGLDLEFILEPVYPEKRLINLDVRLLDGDEFPSLREKSYQGWYEIGKFDALATAKKLMEISSYLEKNDYKLELKTVYSAEVGGAPYYIIKSFIINKKEIGVKKQNGN